MARSILLVIVYLVLCTLPVALCFTPCALNGFCKSNDWKEVKKVIRIEKKNRHYNNKHVPNDVVLFERTSPQLERDESWISVLTSDPQRMVTFSALMTLCGACLGPFLDSYHSAFGVLQYDNPIQISLWGTESQPALTTAWWVPELFGMAGFIIGWLYILLDQLCQSPPHRRTPSGPTIMFRISYFTFQYWLSGILFSSGVDRATICAYMTTLAGGGFLLLDNTLAGLATSIATAIGGPLIEVGLLSILGVYHYTDPGETGFFPLWIAPVYFLGGPAVGNFARGFWELLSSTSNTDLDEAKVEHCTMCNNTRCVGCPNCDAQGYYVTYGRRVNCNACRGRGLVICRDCFSSYGEDPNDIQAIRDIMARMPD
jgi:hypothetical protein